MRFLIAAVLYLVALVMIVVGVAERTIWAPAPSAEYAVVLDSKTPYTLINHATLTKLPGEPTIRIQGGVPTNVLVTARESDIVGWLGDSAQTRVVFDETGEKLTYTNQNGPTAAVDVTKSDMWRSVETNDLAVQQRVDIKDEAALLIASDGTQASPNAISLVWAVKYDLTPSNVLIIAGLIILFAGVLLNLIAYYIMRKKRGPRRRTPRAPQGPRYRPRRKDKNKVVNTRGRRSARKLNAVIGTSLAIASLAGCAGVNPNATPTPTETSLNQIDPAVLDSAQVAKIIADVVTVAAKGDAEKNADFLLTRFEGPALVARTAHYKLQSKDRNIAALPAISDKVVSFVLPSATRTWPRTAMVVTNSDAKDQLPQVLVLQQDTPRDDYKVWYDITVLPGAKFPSVPATEVGSIPVSPDSLFLKVQPTALPMTYGNLIDQGDKSVYSLDFDLAADVFYQQVSKSQADTIAKLTKATVTVTHELGDPNVISLGTIESGALVAVYVNDVYKIKPQKKSAVTVEGNEKLLFGATGSAKGIITTYGDLLLFYVPGASSKDKIQTLGATQFLLSVKGM